VSNNLLYSGIDITKLPAETLYKTMRLLRDLHPHGLDGDTPMWDLRTWKEIHRRSKLPDTDCANCANAWSEKTRARWNHYFGDIDCSAYCYEQIEWPGPKCALFKRNGGPQ